jgi:TPR repeat protein
MAAPQIWAAPSSETPLNLRIVAKETIPSQVVLTVRGVPSPVRLSEGKQFGPGVWVVPLKSISNVKLTTAAGASGKAELKLALVSLDGKPISERKVTLVLASKPVSKAVAAEQTTQPNTSQGSAQVTMAAVTPIKLPPLTGEAKKRALKLQSKGAEMLADGNIISARPYYEAAANRGLPEAAMALAATYDPDELARMKNVMGVMPDITEARKWYQKAQLLGAKEAEARLQRLAN